MSFLDHLNQSVVSCPVKVVEFDSGPIIWFEYPNFIGLKRHQISDPDPKYSPTVKHPSAPLTWTCHFNRLCLDHVMSAAGLLKVIYDENLLQNRTCSVIWAKHPKDKVQLFYQLRTHQKFNHIPGSLNLTRKDSLIKTLKDFCQKFKSVQLEFKNVFHFVPETFRLPEEIDKFRTYLKTTKVEYFISKPAASTKGAGIRILPKKNIAEQVRKQKFSTQKTVMQTYIHKPYLLDGKKFDLRLYVLVTSFHPLRVYIYPEGIVRFCSKEYYLPVSKDVKSTNQDSRAHLTNVSKNTRNSTRLLSSLFRTLSQSHGEETVEFMWDRIKDLVVKTCLAGTSLARKDSNSLGSRFQSKEETCFELLGFDVLIDEELTPWLLEVNLSPSLATGPATNTPKEKVKEALNLKTQMLCDVMYLIGVPYTESFNKQTFFKEEERYEVEKHNTTRSLFETNSLVSKVSNKIKSEREKNRKRKYTHRSILSTKSKGSGKTERKLSVSDLLDNERVIIEKSCEELYRKGHFERIFPPLPSNVREHKRKHMEYLDMLHDEEKYMNCLLRDYEAVVYSELFNTTLLN
eukprot:snap_masked-scaffold_18-processed-gene-6.24-mRNA-1 protein AED:1.00 eAED:1.00 QI:0/-1/0/0/-1/1/1/0/571